MIIIVFSNCLCKALLCINLVSWATTGKMLTDRLPKVSLVTPSPPGTDRIYGSTCHQHVYTYVVPISGDREVFFQILDIRISLFLRKRFHGWTWDSNSRPTTHSLSTTPFIKALLVRWATRKRLTDRLSKVSLITSQP